MMTNSFLFVNMFIFAFFCTFICDKYFNNGIALFPSVVLFFNSVICIICNQSIAIYFEVAELSTGFKNTTDMQKNLKIDT